MRTRTSWRNQERLFKMLGSETLPTSAVIQQPVNNCGNCLFYAAKGRSRATCKQFQAKVYAAAQKECFTNK